MVAKIIKYLVLVLTCLYAVFFIASIWTSWIDPELFVKISMTVAVVYVVLFVFYFIGGIKSDKDLKKDGFLSD